MRRKARTDRNHAEIRDVLRARGFEVIDCSRVGSGFPDLLIARHGRLDLVEVKDGTKPPSARALTADEQKLIDRLARAGVTVRIVSSVEDAVRL